jgi:hypothetical protein
MPNKISTGICRTALALGLVLTAMPAYAGFEWVAPPDQASASDGGYGAPATRRPEVISPVIITGDGAPAMQSVPAGQYGDGFSPDVGTRAEAAPPAVIVMPASQQAMPQGGLSNATLSLPPASAGDVVQGFATMVPLSLALRQVLPVGFNFSIDQNIDMDTLVSYRGGKSWRETVRDMLAPVNLMAHEQGATLTVSRVGAPAVAVASPSGAATMAPAFDNSGPSPVVVSASSGARSGASTQHLADIPAVDVNSADGWSADRGDTLRKVLTVWCKRSGVELQWLAEYDYPMEATAHFSGGFEDAVRQLLAGFENARPQPVAELHTNASAGQMLLVVQARGNVYSN